VRTVAATAFAPLGRAALLQPPLAAECSALNGPQAAIQDAAMQASGGDVGCGRVAAATELLPYMRCMGHASACATLRWGDADQQAWRGAQRHRAQHTAAGAPPMELRRGLLCVKVMAGGGEGCEASGVVQHGGDVPASAAEREEDEIEDD
jgi:hypothetical protein